VVCPATPLEPARTELLDLYEGRNLPGFVMAVSRGGIEADYFAAVDRTYTLQGEPDLAEALRSEVLENLRRFLRSVNFVDSPQEMPAANDAGNLPWIPASCRLEQVAFFDDTAQSVTVLRGLWEKMDSLNQAALVHHELFYREMRPLKDRDSVLSRRAVAHVYSVRGPVPLLDGLSAASQRYLAQTEGANGSTNEISLFHLTPFPAANFSRLQFAALQGRPALAKSWVDVPLQNWNLRFGRSPVDPNYIGCIVRDENTDVVLEGPVQGTMFPGLKVQISYKTGLPVSLRLYRGAELLSEGLVGGAGNCN
jgi:hypothetical protein